MNEICLLGALVLIIVAITLAVAGVKWFSAWIASGGPAAPLPEAIFMILIGAIWAGTILAYITFW
jgi:F0F1-type ATP synthase assembly protein I